MTAGALTERTDGMSGSDCPVCGPQHAEIEHLTAELVLERRRLATSEACRTGLVGVIEELKAGTLHCRI